MHTHPQIIINHHINYLCIAVNIQQFIPHTNIFFNFLCPHWHQHPHHHPHQHPHQHLHRQQQPISPQNIKLFNKFFFPNNILTTFLIFRRCPCPNGHYFIKSILQNIIFHFPFPSTKYPIARRHAWMCGIAPH